jgi:ribonuclease R
MVTIADLREIDDFQMVEQEYALVGKKTGMSFRMGDKVKVQVVAANLEKRQIDFTLKEVPRQENIKAVKERDTTFDTPKKKSTKRKK